MTHIKNEHTHGWKNSSLVNILHGDILIHSNENILEAYLELYIRYISFIFSNYALKMFLFKFCAIYKSLLKRQAMPYVILPVIFPVERSITN